jgi:hypothetical protein
MMASERGSRRRPIGKRCLQLSALAGKYSDAPARSGEMASFTTEYGKVDRPPDSHRIALSVGLSKRALDRKQQHTENSILFESALLKR